VLYKIYNFAYNNGEGLQPNKRGRIMPKQDEQVQTDEATHDGADTADQATTETETPAAVFTQADFDRKVSEAAIKLEKKMEAREAERVAQLERDRLEQNGEHEQLAAQYKAEAEAERAARGKIEYENTARRMLGEMGLAGHADTLIDGTTSIDMLADKAARFKSALEQGVADEVAKLKHTGVGIVPKQTHKTTDKTPDQMSVDEFQEWKKERGLIGR
jgi:hypothetical protein